MEVGPRVGICRRRPMCSDREVGAEQSIRRWLKSDHQNAGLPIIEAASADRGLTFVIGLEHQRLRASDVTGAS